LRPVRVRARVFRIRSLACGAYGLHRWYGAALGFWMPKRCLTRPPRDDAQDCPMLSELVHSE
jgi:hypothetical protein